MVKKRLVDVLRPILDAPHNPVALIEVLRYVVKRGSCYYNDIARGLRMNPEYVLRCLRYLDKHGYVKLRETKRKGKWFRIAIATNLGIRLIELLEAEYDFPDRIWHIYEDYEKLV